jgi:hypothetical protein
LQKKQIYYGFWLYDTNWNSIACAMVQV